MVRRGPLCYAQGTMAEYFRFVASDPSKPNRRLFLAAALAMAGVVGCQAAPETSATTDLTKSASDQPAPEPREIAVPGTPWTIRMVHVPRSSDGGFWLADREIPWELYDHFIYGLDEPSAIPDSAEAAARQANADAVTRPSRPYISMDRGFGRTDYPAISMSRLGAETFCEWLSELTGKRFRLPTAEEWRHACALGGIDAEALTDHAWTQGNSGFTTHPRGRLTPDALGLYDMIGNAAEWTTELDADGRVRGVVLGGSYLTPDNEAGCACAQPETPDWNASDPQFPKSIWWLADGGFIGFRVLMEIKE